MSAGVKRYVVVNDKDGNPRVVPSNQIIPYRAGETIESLETRVRRDLYKMECEQGAQFNGIGEFGKSALKKVWIDNVERDAAFDRRREQAWRKQRERLAYD